MRKIFAYSGAFFAVLAIILTVLPFGTIALIPVVLTLVLGVLAFRISNEKQRILPKIVLVVSVITLLVIIGRDVFVKDVVAVDKQFEQKKEESKKQDIKELEGL